MVDFITDIFAEIADFFIDLWVDKIVIKFAKREAKTKSCQKTNLKARNRR